MAERIISDYLAAGSIDPAADLFLIQQASTNSYRKINRNTILGVSGTPADTSTAQTFSNKTLNNTNIITARDDRFTLQDNLDTTKQAQFQLSGITTATTRTYTLPNASSILADTSTAQTLTNKTITAPVITGGSITNTSISVDSISEFTAANGVTVDGLNIKDGKLNTLNSVINTNITDAAITPVKLQTGTGTSWGWQAWTPTYANLTVGNGTVEARYIQTGKTVSFYWAFLLGTTSSVGTAPSLTLPVPHKSLVASGATPIVGTAWYDNGSVNNQGCVIYTSTGPALIRVFNAASTYLTTSSLTNAIPFAWNPSCTMVIYGTYEAL